jgi:RNA polymerase sigma-70 factor (ECF subfamily)
MTEQLARMAEAECIKLARKGDQDAFAQIVETYQNPVYNLCYRMLGTPQAAEDAAQESFWRAYKNLHRYDMKRPFPTWLLSIAAHYCIDQQRRKRLPTMDLNEIIEFTAEDPAPSPESSLINVEFSDKVQHQLAQLSENDRAVLILRYWHEYSENEICQALSISKSAVKSRLHRARKHMAAQWTETQSSLTMEGRHHETQTI